MLVKTKEKTVKWYNGYSEKIIEAIVKLLQSFIEHSGNTSFSVRHLESKKVMQQLQLPKYIYRLFYKCPDITRYYS